MAKKSVATIQTGSKRFTKAIKMVKKKDSGTYSFVETILDSKHVKDWISNKPIKQEVIPPRPVEQKVTNEEVVVEEKVITEKVTDENESNEGDAKEDTEN